MTKEEFLRLYHEYQTQSKDEAQKEADKINDESDTFSVEVADFGSLGYCLMLSEAKNFIKDLGIFS